ncbi:hypothetical protein BP00DRAFT_17384 [Aspergillus indologenus CBS 114.80]|uniref:Uncharacterized protein n=1 Tax=Aspergillus indologenus CBS 114.80 TaxID=1450541 RepID=A0A2V5I111_9EURO|nr:hypothetical protein BP00DRAFT_17384 [Aspergillus indologenus CBS 114.80]
MDTRDLAKYTTICMYVHQSMTLMICCNCTVLCCAGPMYCTCTCNLCSCSLLSSAGAPCRQQQLSQPSLAYCSFPWLSLASNHCYMKATSSGICYAEVWVWVWVWGGLAAVWSDIYLSMRCRSYVCAVLCCAVLCWCPVLSLSCALWCMGFLATAGVVYQLEPKA